MLVKIEFQFTELMNGEFLKEISRAVDPPTARHPQKHKSYKNTSLQDKNMKCSVDLPFKLTMGL